jgi:hypothetical protein
VLSQFSKNSLSSISDHLLYLIWFPILHHPPGHVSLPWPHFGKNPVRLVLPESSLPLNPPLVIFHPLNQLCSLAINSYLLMLYAGLKPISFPNNRDLSQWVMYLLQCSWIRFSMPCVMEHVSLNNFFFNIIHIEPSGLWIHQLLLSGYSHWKAWSWVELLIVNWWRRFQKRRYSVIPSTEKTRFQGDMGRGC